MKRCAPHREKEEEYRNPLEDSNDSYGIDDEGKSIEDDDYNNDNIDNNANNDNDNDNEDDKDDNE
jgi:hypothetical protein